MYARDNQNCCFYQSQDDVMAEAKKKREHPIIAYTENQYILIHTTEVQMIDEDVIKLMDLLLKIYKIFSLKIDDKLEPVARFVYRNLYKIEEVEKEQDRPLLNEICNQNKVHNQETDDDLLEEEF